MAKVPAVHREARFSGIRVAVSYEKSVLPDTPTSRKQVAGGFMRGNATCGQVLRGQQPYFTRLLNNKKSFSINEPRPIYNFKSAESLVM